MSKYRVVFHATVVVRVEADDAELAERYARADVMDTLAGELVRHEVWISGGDVKSAIVTFDNQAPSIEKETAS